MAAIVAKMTKHELKEIIESTVEKKLLQLLSDPDQGLVLRKTLKDRLLRQRKAVVSGKRGNLLAASSQNGSSSRSRWVPASAGMTVVRRHLRRDDGGAPSPSQG